MSYIRWSTTLPITEQCPECGRMPVVPDPEGLSEEESAARWVAQHAADMERWQKREDEGKRPLCDKCVSPWYVYWDCNSGETRDSQLLAVWGADHPLIDYPTIRSIVDRGAYDELVGFAEFGDPYGTLSGALKAWLADVEEQFNTPAIVAAAE